MKELLSVLQIFYFQIPEPGDNSQNILRSLLSEDYKLPTEKSTELHHKTDLSED